ncbi:MAG TPA: cysteine-rich CWC family protein [Ramlibacter sp.]|nr:cysteine-rich CWC family protein [Ramlibacter sp.]
MPSASATRCPLCGRENQCAMEIERATGVQQPPCWCMEVDFTAELLATLPPQARGIACICRACAQADQPGSLPSSLALRKPPVP